MDIFDTIDRTIEVFELEDSESERVHRIMLMSAVAIVIKMVPVPDDFKLGETKEEARESSKIISNIINENAEVREAIAVHFSGVLESLGSSLAEEKVETLKGILKEFRG